MADEEHDAEEEDFHFLLFGNDDGDGGTGTGSSSEEEEEEDNDAGDDFEFLLGVQDGRPPIHHQEGRDTCVFHAITFAAEMEMRRRRVPTTDITFNADAFAADYEREIGMNLRDQSAAPVGTFPSYHREATGLRLFRRDGVLARSAAWEGERRLRISSFRVHRNVNGVSFARVAELISEGRPVIGVMRGNERFRRLPPGEIYDYYLPDKAGPGGEDDEMYTHAVAFVGYGVRQGREYLILANRHGVGFGEDGLARVYFDHSVYDDRFYTLTVSPPAADQDRPSSSAAVPPRLLRIGSSRSSGSGAAHNLGFFFFFFFFNTVVSGSSSSTAPSSSGSGSGAAHDLGFFINTVGSSSLSDDGAGQRFFEVSSAAATPTAFLDDGSAFSPLFSSPSDIQSFFFNDDSAFSLSPYATHNSFDGGSSTNSPVLSSPTTTHSSFVAPVAFFDDESTAN